MLPSTDHGKLTDLALARALDLSSASLAWAREKMDGQVEETPVMDRQATEIPSTWLHVSPGRNLADILSAGLQANREGGNYAGYETSLDGVYVSRNPTILRSHLFARDVCDHYLIVVVEVSPEAGALIDEDVLHSWLDTTTDEVLAEHGLCVRDAVDGSFGPDDTVWLGIAPAFAHNLGPRDDVIAAGNPSLLEEYVDAWVRHDVYGEDVDGLWWPGAKDTLVRMYPAIRHPAWGDEFLSLRIPGSMVGYAGSARVAGIVEVSGGNPRLAYGTLAGDARELVADMIQNAGCCPDPLAEMETSDTTGACRVLLPA